MTFGTDLRRTLHIASKFKITEKVSPSQPEIVALSKVVHRMKLRTTKKLILHGVPEKRQNFTEPFPIKFFSTKLSKQLIVFEFTQFNCRQLIVGPMFSAGRKSLVTNSIVLLQRYQITDSQAKHIRYARIQIRPLKHFVL